MKRELARAFFAGAGSSSALFPLAIFWFALPALPAVSWAQGGVSPGDMVETNINYQPVTGEVLR